MIDLSHYYRDIFKSSLDMFRYGVRIKNSIILPSATNNDVLIFNVMDQTFHIKTIEKKYLSYKKILLAKE